MPLELALMLLDLPRGLVMSPRASSTSVRITRRSPRTLTTSSATSVVAEKATLPALLIPPTPPIRTQPAQEPAPLFAEPVDGNSPPIAVPRAVASEPLRRSLSKRLNN